MDMRSHEQRGNPHACCRLHGRSHGKPWRESSLIYQVDVDEERYHGQAKGMMEEDLCGKEADWPSRLQYGAHGRGHQEEDGQDLSGKGHAEHQAVSLEFSFPGQEEGIDEGDRESQLQYQI